MNPNRPRHPLFRELLADPHQFEERGRAYQLLEAYFDGEPVETLRPLLNHPNLLVKRAAVWVASELGAQSSRVLEDVIAVIDFNDQYLTYHALEVALVCAVGDKAEHFVCIPRALESSDDVLRVLAMRLLARADDSQLQRAIAFYDRVGNDTGSHNGGLRLLAAGESASPIDVQRLLSSGDLIAEMYGAIAAKRLRTQHPDLLSAAANTSDQAVRRFIAEPV